MKFLKLFIFFIFNSIILLSGCSSIDTNLGINEQISSSEMVPDELKRIPVNVVRVVDGDTAVITIPDSFREQIKERYGEDIEKDITIRFIGIDTPESTKKVQLYGPESKAFTTTLLTKSQVEIELDEKVLFDRYGRLLVHVFANGQSVQQILLEEGLARVAYVFDNYNYLDMYRDAEEVAKEKQLNIWSIPNYVSERGYNMEVIADFVSNNQRLIENINLNGIRSFIQSFLSE